MDFLTQLNNSNVLVLGAGVTGMSCARFLASKDIAFSLNDSRDAVLDAAMFSKEFPHATLSLGKWDTKLIAAADIIIISPGIDLATPALAAKRDDCEVIGDVEIYCRLKDTPILAVTGSNGKSTVVSLLAHIGEQLGKQVALGGNIGVPVLDNIALDLDCLILELSSFQLESMHSMQAVAATVLNVSDDHLDRHKTLENYQAIKQRIYSQASCAIVNRQDNRTFTSHNHQISFGDDKPGHNQFGLYQGALYFGEQKLVDIASLTIAGKHNAINALAALALGYELGWPLEDMAAALSSFEGLAHRCQKVSDKAGITWINDSKATNVGATEAAIEGLAAIKPAGSNIVLIAGGEGKGANFSPLAPLFEQALSVLITLGKDGPMLAQLKKGAIEVEDMEQAVECAYKHAKAGDIVILSPACASLDMYKNYMVRGEVFKQAVDELTLEEALV
ncbi:UDP-N-acetylmuramoyl-L-alanine--D-glutamate ligase [Thalassotalea agarivorans]|uniref:UDP-N-acetylmuramoylalanine--D-glutamate ligase n=1 Tax=Thalassotalea agarivorans TaxID=349064 RepID=A0A1I0AZN4_THASX|nr:UDP-N-acetylmuramoyl-L-alanine--D-glutamate ligase [Thalassotalea agarivorans]SES99876.1 UDP-N-acetylmuramoylalanine--D-glutamate ligase [Thalassotalea agarivorans]